MIKPVTNRGLKGRIPTMAKASYQHFLVALADSGLVNRHQIEACRRYVRKMACDLPPTSAMWADALVRAGHLTAFQARVTLQGRFDELLLDNYVVTDQVGRDDLGTVLKAHPRIGADWVVVKMISDELATAVPLAPGLTDLASHTRQLDHPNIVHVLDVHPQPDRPYVVSEFVKGTDLKHLMRSQGRLPPRLAMDLVRPAAEGLAFAHRQGLAHGNINPGSILVTPDGSTKLADFGIIRLDRASDLHQLDRVVAMFDYIAPERTANLSRVDLLSDQYSLGCTLYHMVTGRPPFPNGGAMTKLLAHQTKAPTHPRQLAPDVPDEMARLIGRLMAKDPADRFRSPTEWLDAIQHPIPSDRYVRGVSPSDRARPDLRPPRRRWRRARSLVGPVAAAAMIAGMIVVAWPRPRTAGHRRTRPTRVASPSLFTASVSAAGERARGGHGRASAARARPIVVDPMRGPVRSLGAAVALAGPDAVVELHHPGPYRESGLVVRGRGTLTVRAAPGVRPMVVLDVGRRPGQSVTGTVRLIECHRETLNLYGLHVVARADPADRDPLELIRHTGTSLTVQGCSFRVAGRSGSGRTVGLGIRGRTADRPVRVALDDCSFTGLHRAVAVRRTRGGVVRMAGCLFVGVGTVLTVDADARIRPADRLLATFVHNTVHDAETMVHRICAGCPRAALPLVVDARDNLVLLRRGRNTRGLMHAEFARGAPRPLVGVVWTGRNNGCVPGMVCMYITPGARRNGWVLRNPADWNAYWGARRAHVFSVAVRFRGGDGRSPADYALRERSPGWRQASDGRDLGCDSRRLAWATWIRR